MSEQTEADALIKAMELKLEGFAINHDRQLLDEAVGLADQYARLTMTPLRYWRIRRTSQVKRVRLWLQFWRWMILHEIRIVLDEIVMRMR